MVNSSEWMAIGQVVKRLREHYPAVPADTVTTIVHRHHARFDESPVRDFVPLFVERGSRRDLAVLDSC